MKAISGSGHVHCIALYRISSDFFFPEIPLGWTPLANVTTYMYLLYLLQPKAEWCIAGARLQPVRHGVDLAGIMGDAWRGRMVMGQRWVGAEWGRYGEGCPLSSRLGVSSVVSSPSGVRGGAPAENGFWCILKATERSFLYKI